MTNTPAGTDRLLAAIEKISQVRRALTQEIATRNGLSPLQVELLRLIGNGPPPEPRPTELALELATSTATLADALQALRRKELITDRPDPVDGRRKTLALTTKGRRVARSIENDFEPFHAALSERDQPDAPTAVYVLLAVIRRLFDTGVVGVDRSCVTCAHYSPDEGPYGSCGLLQISLTPSTLRVRCHEHAPSAPAVGTQL